MRTPKRHIFPVLLLLLMVSHVSVAAHVATHIPGELGECELCISYGDSTAVIDSCHEQGIPLAVGAGPVLYVDSAARSALILVLPARGPPRDS